MLERTRKTRYRTSFWALSLLLGACQSGSGIGPSGGQDSGGERPGQPGPGPSDLDPRALDILFMVDNSPSMDPKQKALAAAFPNMLGELQKIPAGVPDLHIGVVSSDMGAGGGESGGGGSSVLGNQGILWGNDPNVDPMHVNNKYATVRDFENSAGAPGCGMNSGARWIEDVRSQDGNGRAQNYQGNLSNVFACLAQAVGVGGIGYEHQLQSVRVALHPIQNINPQNFGFLRPKAYLAIVLVSDEDDCSAPPNNDENGDMFVPRTKFDTASLRCAARGHVCHGQDIPNFEPTQGYTGSAPFVAKFSDCDAKDDTGTPRDYTKLPLIRVRDLVDSVNQVKAWPAQQIMAAGIFGWPQGSLAGVEYRIDKDPTSLPAESQKLWDYLPICMIPDKKSNDGNLYKAYGGLRLKKFLDAFRTQDETNVFSICNPDFSEAMTQIGRLLAGRLAAN